MNSMFESTACAAHLRDLAHLDRAAVEVGVEQGHALRRARRLLERRRAGQDQHLLGDLGGRGPDLAADDDVAVAVAHRPRLEPGRVEPDIGLGHREAGLFLAGDQRRQKAPLLLVGAEHDDRVQPENVHVHRRGAAEPGAGLRDRLHDDRRLGDAEPAAAIFLRHRDAEPAALRPSRGGIRAGSAPSVSFCSQYSSPKRSHSRATASRISSCSAVNAKLIALSSARAGRTPHRLPLSRDHRAAATSRRRARASRRLDVDNAARGGLSPACRSMGARGGIGRRARFRSVFRKEWWFDSTRAHHSNSSTQAAIFPIKPIARTSRAA